VDDDEEDGFLKAFKVLSMLYYSVHFYLCASSKICLISFPYICILDLVFVLFYLMV
jgi:hypothetical protein